MTKILKIFILIFVTSLFCEFDLNAATYDVNVSTNSVFIEKSSTKDIDVIQNGSIVFSAYYDDTIVIKGDGILTTNYVDVNIDNLTDSINLQLSKVNINTSNSYYAGFYVHGTSNNIIDINLFLEDNNIIKSDGKYGGNTSNGISGKFAENANLLISSNGNNELSGFDCGIYWKDGNLIINNGTYNIYSTFADSAISGTGIYVNNGDLIMNGGTITSSGKANGIYATKRMFIYGGTLKTTGEYRRGLYVSGYLEIRGGIINATGVTSGLQVGETTSNSLCLRIYGGTIIAKASGSSNDYIIYGKKPKINGASIKGTIFSTDSLVNFEDDEVTLFKIRLEDQIEDFIDGCTINGYTCLLNNPDGNNYGIQDVKSDSDGILYFYLKKLDDAKVTMKSINYQNNFMDSSEIKYILYKDRLLIFHFNVGNKVKQVQYKVPYGEIFSESLPSIPKLTGYKFSKWINMKDSMPFYFNTPIKVNTNLKAIYTPNKLILKTIELKKGMVNKKYKFTLNSANGGVPEINYSLTGLPDGLKFNPSTRVISGIPKDKGTYTIKYTANDSYTPSQKATINLKLVIEDEQNSITNAGNDLTIPFLIILTGFSLILFKRKLN